MGRYIVNINDVEAGRIPGREIRDLINENTVGAKGVSLRITDLLPGETSYPGHIHSDSEEVIFVLSGKGEIKIGDETFPMNPGDAIYLPAGLKHLMRNTGKEAIRLACTFTSCDMRRDLVNDESMDF